MSAALAAFFGTPAWPPARQDRLVLQASNEAGVRARDPPVRNVSWHWFERGGELERRVEDHPRIPVQTAEDLCALGGSLPHLAIAISTQDRMRRVKRVFTQMCFPDDHAIVMEAPIQLDGTAVKPSDDPALQPYLEQFSAENLLRLTPGETAIHIAHKAALELCVAEGERFGGCLIFEDDFTASGPMLTERWRRSSEKLPKDWDVLFLGKCFDQSCGKGRVSEDADLWAVPDNSTQSPRCFHSYAVSLPGAKRLLEGLSQCRHASRDRFVNDFACAADMAADFLLAANSKDGRTHGTIFSIGPSLFTQSAAHRIEEGSTSAEDGQRPVVVMDCSLGLQLATDAAHSAIAPSMVSSTYWSRMELDDTAGTAGIRHGPSERMVRLASFGLHEPRREACEALAQEANRSGATSFFSDDGWQPAVDVPDVYVALQACALETARDRKPTRLTEMVGPWVLEPWVKRPEPTTRAAKQLGNAASCPLIGGAPPTGVDEMRLSMLKAGYVHGYEGELHGREPQPPGVQYGSGLTNHETNLWPRPATCAYRSGPRLDLLKLKREKLTKLVNKKRGLEYRPTFLPASSLLQDLIPCLQPDEWKEVPMDKPMPQNYTLLVVYRDPLEHFASALREVMGQLLDRQCPMGRCDPATELHSPDWKGVRTKAMWMSEAEGLLSNGTANPDALRRLIRNAALDMSCNLGYHASEYFASQTGMWLQGHTPPFVPVAFFDASELGSDADAQVLLRSKLFRTMAGTAPVPSEQELGVCLGRALKKYADHGSVRSLMTNRATRPSADALLAEFRRHPEHGKLPSTDELLASIRGDVATEQVVSAAYALDVACIGAIREAMHPLKTQPEQTTKRPEPRLTKTGPSKPTIPAEDLADCSSDGCWPTVYLLGAQKAASTSLSHALSPVLLPARWTPHDEGLQDATAAQGPYQTIYQLRGDFFPAVWQSRHPHEALGGYMDISEVHAFDANLTVTDAILEHPSMYTRLFKRERSRAEVPLFMDGSPVLHHWVAPMQMRRVIPFAHMPLVRLIAVLREPVARHLSIYNHARSIKLGGVHVFASVAPTCGDSFAEEVACSLDKWNQCVENAGVEKLTATFEQYSACPGFNQDVKHAQYVTIAESAVKQVMASNDLATRRLMQIELSRQGSPTWKVVNLEHLAGRSANGTSGTNGTNGTNATYLDAEVSANGTNATLSVHVADGSANGTNGTNSTNATLSDADASANGTDATFARSDGQLCGANKTVFLGLNLEQCLAECDKVQCECYEHRDDPAECHIASGLFTPSKPGEADSSARSESLEPSGGSSEDGSAAAFIEETSTGELSADGLHPGGAGGGTGLHPGDHQIRLAHGMYYGQLEQWRRFFPRDQILVLSFEQLTDVAANEGVMKDILSFVGAPDDSLERLAPMPHENDLSANPRERAKKVKVVPCDAKRQLKEFFSPWNKALYSMLTEDHANGLAPAQEKPFPRFEESVPCEEI